ncbi:glycoside hydrolase family 5 protein [Paenibacillus sp. SYP-B4298]|uniref:glycoside hydrolase family 5 protein n=1 Tax=Paenibacillus sp. SYP-B4298 TaxID=2996034 RepID=UPI0022DD840B|nr:glycoside hydrolase family 5 protein [Paenibacillus sp. SYP-B4298]
MRFIGILVAIVLLTGCTWEVNAMKGASKPQGKESVEVLNVNPDVYQQARALGRSVNLGNALDAPYEGAWDMALEESYFKLIKDKGFDSVRLPVRFSNKTTWGAPYTIDEGFLQRVDWAIDKALEQNLAIIVDLHHFEEMFTNPHGQKDRFLSIWNQLSQRYKNRPAQVYYELLNEPNGALTPELWNQYLNEAITVIRANDPHRTLIVGGTDWNSVDGLYKLQLPAQDRNIIATFHYYGPILFTHQGAEWMTAEYGTTGLTWPGPPAHPVEPVQAARNVDWVANFFRDYNTKTGADNPASRERLVADFERAARWGQDNGRPIFLGEFGAYKTADMNSRITWTQTVRSEAERLGMSWSYWEFGAAFGLYDRSAHAWREDLTSALLP